MEQQPERTPFRVDTEIVPAGVDLQLAGQRNRLIESWRRGEVAAENTMRDLLKLYWINQQRANDETRHYLIDGAACDFSIEADMDQDTADKLWVEAQELYAQ
jgi:hypothetical protein